MGRYPRERGKFFRDEVTIDFLSKTDYLTP